MTQYLASFRLTLRWVAITFNFGGIMNKLLLLSVLFFLNCSVYADSALLKFGTHYYKRYDQPMNWHAGNAFCSQKGGYLAVITSESENDFIKAKFTSSISNHGTWLGGSDEATEGTWKWVNNEKWSYSKWSAAEPNNMYFEITPQAAPSTLPDYAKGEHYLMIWKNGLWNDGMSVNRGTYNYQPMSSLCEFEL